MDNESDYQKDIFLPTDYMSTIDNELNTLAKLCKQSSSTRLMQRIQKHCHHKISIPTIQQKLTHIYNIKPILHQLPQIKKEATIFPEIASNVKTHSIPHFIKKEILLNKPIGLMSKRQSVCSTIDNDISLSENPNKKTAKKERRIEIKAERKAIDIYTLLTMQHK